MNRFLAGTLAGAALLAGAAPSRAQEVPSYEGAFATLADGMQALSDSLPRPPATKEDAAKIRAATTSLKAAEKALARPNLLGWFKAAARIRKALAKGFPADPDPGARLEAATGTLGLALLADTSVLEASVALLPEGPERDALAAAALAAYTDCSAHVGTAWSEALDGLAGVARDVVSLRKDYGKEVRKIVGRRGVSALVNGVAYSSRSVEGTMTEDPRLGRPDRISFKARRPDGDSTLAISLAISRSLTGGGILPGTFEVGDSGVTAEFTLTGIGGLEGQISGNAGTITIYAYDLSRGSVTGAFAFSGPALPEGTGAVTEGTFNLSGLGGAASE